MSDIFQEVEEEVRREQYMRLWNRYGGYVIGAAVALVLGVAGYIGWQTWDAANRAEHSTRYMEAARLLEQGREIDALAAFRGISREGRSGYRMLARFQEAAILREIEDHDAAIRVYDAVAADTSVPVYYRDLARLSAARLMLDQGKYDDIPGRVEALTGRDNVWRHAASELLGVSHYLAGRHDEARRHLELLALDASAPEGVRGRASDLLSLLMERHGKDVSEQALNPVEPMPVIPGLATGAEEDASLPVTGVALPSATEGGDPEGNNND